MTTIIKKVFSEHFFKILTKDKLFEIRLADFEINDGDTLILRERTDNKYTGNQITAMVSCVYKLNELKYWTPDQISRFGLQVIGFEPDFEFGVNHNLWDENL